MFIASDPGSFYVLFKQPLTHLWFGIILSFQYFFAALKKREKYLYDSHSQRVVSSIRASVSAEAAKAIFVWHQNFQLRRDEMELTSLEINLPHNLDEIQSTTQTGLPFGLFDKFEEF